MHVRCTCSEGLIHDAGWVTNASLASIGSPHTAHTWWGRSRILGGGRPISRTLAHNLATSRGSRADPSSYVDHVWITRSAISATSKLFALRSASASIAVALVFMVTTSAVCA